MQQFLSIEIEFWYTLESRGKIDHGHGNNQWISLNIT